MLIYIILIISVTLFLVGFIIWYGVLLPTIKQKNSNKNNCAHTFEIHGYNYDSFSGHQIYIYRCTKCGYFTTEDEI